MFSDERKVTLDIFIRSNAFLPFILAKFGIGGLPY